jgi:hypothetical protein
VTERQNPVQAALILTSDTLSGIQIGDVLGLQPSRIHVKGAPTEQPEVREHPFHIAIFKSPLETAQRLEAHLDAVLVLCEIRREKLRSLQGDCTVHSTSLALLRSSPGTGRCRCHPR